MKNRTVAKPKTGWVSALGLGLLLLGASLLPAQADVLGINFVGTGGPVTDAGGAFGVPLANWRNLDGPAGLATLQSPNNWPVQVQWTTGGGVWGANTAGFTTTSPGENQVLSGCLWAQQATDAGPIVVTVSGLSAVTTEPYTLRLVAGIDGGPAFRPALVNGTAGLDIVVAEAPGDMWGSSAGLELTGDSFTFSIAHDSPGVLRAILSGLTITYTPAPPPSLSVTLQSPSQTVPLNSDVVLSASASGVEPISVQWQFNEADLFGEIGYDLYLFNVTPDQAGRYRLKATDGLGVTLYSEPLHLNVAGGEPVVVYDASTATTYSSVGTHPPGIGLFFSVLPGTSVSVEELGATSASPALGETETLTVQLFNAGSGAVLDTVTFGVSDTPTELSLPSAAPLYRYLKPVAAPVVLGGGTYAVVQYGGTYANVPVGLTINGASAIQQLASRWVPPPGGPGVLPTVYDGADVKYAGPTFKMSVAGSPDRLPPTPGRQCGRDRQHHPGRASRRQLPPLLPVVQRNHRD